MIRVVEINGAFIFPIFKNGKSSIEAYAEQHRIKWLFNEQTKKLQEITVFVRHPKERFVSGVHSFIEFERRKNKNLNYETILYFIENNMLTNEHFMPQVFWIKNLLKYYSGTISIKNVEELYRWIPNRNRPGIPKITEDQKKKISTIEYKNLKYDNILFEKYVNKKIKIDLLILEIENALS